MHKLKTKKNLDELVQELEPEVDAEALMKEAAEWRGWGLGETRGPV